MIDVDKSYVGLFWDIAICNSIYDHDLYLNFRNKTLALNMFDGPSFPKSLDEEVFNLWLEKGRLSRIGYLYLLVVWDEYGSEYHPVYAAHRDEIESHRTPGNRERLIAVYDLYSESRII